MVSRHYLGSINHTLLTVSLLRQKGFDPFIIYSGDEHTPTEAIIQKMSGATVLGRVDEASIVNRAFIKKQAKQLQAVLIPLQK